MITNERIRELETAIHQVLYFRNLVEHESFYDEFFDVAIRSMKKEKKLEELMIIKSQEDYYDI